MKSKLFNRQPLILGVTALFLTVSALFFNVVTAQTSQSNLPPIPLDSTQATEYIDIRGVGDSGMALTYQQPPTLNDILPQQGVRAHFGIRLDALDNTGKSYRGDLSFINWETVVGPYCNRFRGRPSPSSYTFVTHPDQLIEAYRRGFNLIGLANNHSWDCPVGERGMDGALMTAQYMNWIENRMGNISWIWHGVDAPRAKSTAKVKTMTIKGKPIRVAFASLYLGGACNNITCNQDKTAVLRSLQAAEADLRILSIHSWNDSTQVELVRTGKDFIQNYNGDIVFGHGPHVWKPVNIVQSNSGKRGVMFESLGNFIHPNLAPKQQDMIGRVLVDINTLQIKQVQAIPLKVDAAIAGFAGALNPSSIPASNFRWQTINDPNWHSGVNQQADGVYYNVN